MTIGTPSGRPFAVASSGMRHIVTVLAVAAVLATVWLAQPGTACNEQVCASVVSKCMLTASCKCDLKNCSCCKECFNCLSYLYTECCSCVGEFSWRKCAYVLCRFLRREFADIDLRIQLID